MTIIDRGKEYLEAIVAAAAAENVLLPKERYVILGSSRATCESVVVAISSVDPFQDPNDPLGQFAAACNRPLQLSITAGIVREGIAFNNDGSTDVDAVKHNNELLENDKDVLFAAVDLLEQGIVDTVIQNMSWEYEGLLMSSTIVFTTGESVDLG